MLNARQVSDGNRYPGPNTADGASRLSEEVWDQILREQTRLAPPILAHPPLHHQDLAIVAQAGEGARRERPRFIDDPHSVEVAFRHMFVLADRNGNGRISATEARQLLANRDLTGPNACVAAALRVYFEEIRALRNDGGDGISRGDINRLMSLWRQRVNGEEMSTANGALIDRIRRRIGRTQQMLENSSMELFANRDNPVSSVRAEAVIQSSQTNNCNFVGGLAGLANVNPAAIVNMIRDNRDGTCLVRFPAERGAGNNPREVTVRTPTQAELAYHWSGSPHGTWATVLQAAHGVFLDRRAPAGGEIEAGDGWGIYRGLNMLTGEPYGWWAMRYMWDSTLHRIVNEHLRNRLPVSVIATSMPVLESVDNDAVLGIPVWHHYAVLEMNGDMQTGNVVLYNPHGASGLGGGLPRDVVDLGGGRFRMSFQRFASRFNVLVYR